MKRLLSVFLFLHFYSISYPQQIVLVGLTKTSPVGFAFTATEPVPGNTTFYFTFEGYSLACDGFYLDWDCFVSGDKLLTYETPDDGLAKGEVVVIYEGATGTFKATGAGGYVQWTESCLMDLPMKVVHAFSSDNPDDPLNNISQIHSSINMSRNWGGVGTATGDSPLADYPNDVVLFLPKNDNGEYAGSLRDEPTALTDLAIAENWSFSDSHLDLSISAFSEFGPLLCITISGFEVNAQETRVLLTWRAECGLNVGDFDVQRSQDGAAFKTIGQVAPTGTVTPALGQSYEFIDKTPFDEPNYYRLRQYKYDGTYEFTDVVQVTFEGGQGKQLAVSPNPSDDGLFEIIIPENEEPNIPIYIYDTSGVLRYETSAQGTEAKVDINDLKDGLYLVRVLLGREWMYAMVVVD